LWLFAALTVLIVLTSSSHRLFYIEPYVSTDGPFPTFSAVRGPWYYAHVAVLQLSAVASALILIRNALRSDRRHRRQSLTMAVGGVFPIVAGFAFVAGLVPWGIDPAPLSLAATGIVFAIALFRLGLLEIVPAARELAIDSIRDGFVVADASGRIQDANPAILAMLGKDTGRLSERLDPLSTAGRALGPLLELGEGTIEFTISDSEGRERRLQANAYPVVGRRGGRKGAALLISDITETTALLARLKELADKDSLTGLVNRRRFLEQADREIDLAQREGFPLGFAMADLDHFKNVNDIYGHAAGDFVLVNAARRIESALRSVDIVCRYGGEEFAILIPGAAGDDVFQAAERARAALADSPFDWEGRQISVTGSFGTWHRATDSSESLEECLRKADGAMYAAKAAGRNRVWRAG
jgi:diguanylate cyclase (GGDEF)-like protein